MKLSEAMRIGASWSGQCTERMKDGNKICALGAAWEGTFGTLDLAKFPENWAELLVEKFPYGRAFVCMPVGSLGSIQLLDAIWRLNDNHGWSRDKIADWIETLERKNNWGGEKPAGKVTLQILAPEISEPITDNVIAQESQWDSTTY